MNILFFHCQCDLFIFFPQREEVNNLAFEEGCVDLCTGVIKYSVPFHPAFFIFFIFGGHLDSQD